MKTTNSSFSHRKVLIIAIVIFAVIILLPFIIVVTNKIPVKKTNGPEKPAMTATTSFNPFVNGGREEQSAYSIAYPQNSEKTANTFDGGTSFIIQPPNGAYPGEPVFDVEAYNSKQNLTQKEMWYVAAGATVNELDINDMKLPELKNTYQMRTIHGTQIKTPTQLRIAYLVEPNALYVFRMYYSSAVTIPADEDLFADFIKSFVLKQ